MNECFVHYTITWCVILASMNTESITHHELSPIFPELCSPPSYAAGGASRCLSAQTALRVKVVAGGRYFRLDYKTQNVPSLQVRAVMEKCNRFYFFWVGFATQIFRAVHTRTTGSGTRARVVRTGFRPGSDTRVVVEAVKRGGGKLSVTIFCNNIWAF